MRAVKRWRYYCDHCKKVSGLRSAMEKHEKGCTLNPNRRCGICDFLTTGGTPLSELMALLPDPAKFKHMESWDAGAEFGGSGEYEVMDDEALAAATHAVLPKLRELTDNCPACILAALRQRGIPVPIVTEFNFGDDMKEAQSAMQAHRDEQKGRYY